jgi:hypothetical protein
VNGERCLEKWKLLVSLEALELEASGRETETSEGLIDAT